MKKITYILICLIIVFSTCVTVASAEELKAEVYVNISDKGALAVTYEKVTVTDIDDDGALTINDTLVAAHDAFYKGGAESGYASAESEFGVSIVKLWGDTSGSYGYYINNASAWSLADPVKSGDLVSAFVYTDTLGWSDSYSFFDVNKVDAKENESITLTLSVAGFDESWNSITLPLKDAAITINGEKNDYITDKDGKVSISLESGGRYVVSAVTEETIIVPPVCIFSVSEAENDGNVNEIPEPGDTSNVFVFIIIALASLITVFVIGKGIYER